MERYEKINHNTTKDYKPISLLSLLLKKKTEKTDRCPCKSHFHTATLTRKLTALDDIIGTIDNTLDNKEYVLTSFLDIKGTFTFHNGKSVNTPLHDVIGTIENTLDKNEYVLTLILDIEGAFTSEKISSILEALNDVGIDQ